MDSCIWAVSALVVALQLLQPGRAQVVPFKAPSTRICTVSQQDLRVLPTAGFGRGVLQPYSATQFAPSAAPVPSVSAQADCLFVSFDPEFEVLLGDNPTIYQVGPSRAELWAVETPAWLPDTDELVFSSWLNVQPSNMSRLDLKTGEVVTVPISPSFGNIGGAQYYNGQVIVTSPGIYNSDSYPPGIYLVDPYTGNYTVVMNNWFGQRFNGFDDLIALKDGTIIASDTNYSTQATPPYPRRTQLPPSVWILPPTGAPRVLISWEDIPINPNGFALSPDEQTLYVGNGPNTPTDPEASALVNQVFAFDLRNISGGIFASGKRVFATSDFGFYDGIKVDGKGYFYGSCGDGVQVFNPAGKIIGKILLPSTMALQQHPSNAVGFAGNRLVMMHETDVLLLQLNTIAPPFVSNE